MSATLTGLRAFLTAYGPWILGSLIPSLIVGLTISPKTQGVAAVLKKILDFFSVLTHKDVAGTFQLPFKLGKLVKAAKPTVLLILLALCGIGIAVSACCAWTHSCAPNDIPGQIATKVIDCGVAAVKAEAENLLPAIVAILTGNAADWKAQLNALEAVGEGALACAMQDASQELLAASLPPPGEGTTAAPATLDARVKATAGHNHADAYIKEHGWVFGGGKR